MFRLYAAILFQYGKVTGLVMSSKGRALVEFERMESAVCCHSMVTIRYNFSRGVI